MTNFVTNMEHVIEPGYATLLVDIVGSRAHDDRTALQADIVSAAAVVNAQVPALDPLTPTVGDELQGTYADLVHAIRAAAELRLELVGRAEIRAGIGWGEIVMHDPARTPFGQDGSAWWSARSALDAVASSTPRSGYAARLGLEVAGSSAQHRAQATPARSSEGRLPAPRPLAVDLVALLRSHLALLDRALATVDATEARIVLGDLHGESTERTADRLGISPSAVSQRRGRNHLRELVVALRLIDTCP